MTTVLLVLLSLTAAADTLAGRVVGVADGDTLTLLVDQQTVKVRLEGIDAPEKKQPFGQRARQALSDLTFGKAVRVEAQGKDKYGRTLGRVFVGDTDVNLALVERGLAWHYKQYSKEKKLADAEQAARTAKAGLWGDPAPTPPWEWRRNQR